MPNLSTYQQGRCMIYLLKPVRHLSFYWINRDRKGTYLTRLVSTFTVSTNIFMDYKAVRLYTGSGYEDFKVGKEVKASHITQENLGVIKNIRLEEKAVVVTFMSGDVFYYYGLNFRAQL